MKEYLYLIRNKEGVGEKKEERGKGLKGIIKVGGLLGEFVVCGNTVEKKRRGNDSHKHSYLKDPHVVNINFCLK